MEDYVKLEIVGSGSYGTVFRCRHKVTGEIVAVKQLNDDDANDLIRKTAVREARILKQLQHPHVVRLLELFRSKTRLYMVFEFMDQTILKLLEGKARGLPSGEVKRILWQLVLALTFLHGQRIIHRDLKPENVLIDDKATVKLADFGFARPHTPLGGPGGKLSPYVATRWYRAPELLVGDKYGAGVDIWALGCLLVELTTGQPLFPGRSDADQLWLILRATGCSPRQLALMRDHPSLKMIKLPTEEQMQPLEQRFAYLDKPTQALLKACLAPDPKDLFSSPSLGTTRSSNNS
ncbi:cyclin-dependent kinase-like 4-like protein [Haematococcus lacustris]